jgi:arylsulfatase A-like enzyme
MLPFTAAVGVVACASSPPNVLLFFPDELRYDWGGLHNNPYYSHNASQPPPLPLFTPHIDALARNGTRFTRAFVGAPVCAPSRACLAAGRQYDQNTVPENFHNDFDVGSVRTFYSVLRDDGGYWTMATGRDDLDKSSGGPGFAGAKHTAALGFNDSVRCDGSTDVTFGGAPHEPFGAWLRSQPVANASTAARYNATDLFALQAARFAELGHARVGDETGPFGGYGIPDPMPLPDAAYQDNWIGEQALALLRRRPMRGGGAGGGSAGGGSAGAAPPFFLQVSHQAPHPPMDITDSMMASNDLRGRAFPPPAFFSPGPGAAHSAEEVVIGRQNYAAKVERLDYWLGRYVALLDEQGALSSTVICLASDHGEMLFDRGATAKSKPWSSASSVPLVCAGPGIARGAVVAAPVSTVDLAPTFLDFGGVLGSAPPGMSTTSLRPAMAAAVAGPALPLPARDVVRFGLDNFRGVVRRVNSSCVLKFFCCGGGSANGTGAAGGRCPGSTSNDTAGFGARQDEHHLFNIADDRFEGPASDLRARFPVLAAEYAALLPPPHVTADNPDAVHPNQGHGYRWFGCRMDDGG